MSYLAIRRTATLLATAVAVLTVVPTARASLVDGTPDVTPWI